MHVTHVLTLADALNFLTATPPRHGAVDVVVADLRLEDAEGPRIVTALRAAGAAPVVVLSGLQTAGLAAELTAAGAVAHVLKGREYENLTAAIRVALGRA